MVTPRIAPTFWDRKSVRADGVLESSPKACLVRLPGINSPPITYTRNSRRYLTVLTSVRSVLNRVMKVADRAQTRGSARTFAVTTG
jgi:hypothetical protein